MNDRKLTPKQDKFVAEYLATGNASEAYRRAYDCSRMLPVTINNRAYDQLKNSLIAARIEEIRNRAANAAVMDRAGVLSLITEIATADASEFSEIQIRNCRHCWGTEHRYQWVNPKEYAYRLAAIADADAAAHAAWEERVNAGKRETEPRPTPMPSDEGGYGFDVRGAPNPECPDCHGDGIEHVRFKDTRKLSRGARRLFAGVKRTREGLEIKTRDQDKAMDLLARAHKIVGPETAVAMQVNNAPGGTVQTVVVPSDPLQAAQAYQELMKG